MNSGDNFPLEAAADKFLLEAAADLYSSKFGSFILHAAVGFERYKEDALFMISSASESSSECCVSTRSWCSESFGLWSTGFNGICGYCAYGSGESGSGGWWWTTDDGLCGQCWTSHNYVVEEEKKKDDDQVSSKMDSFLGGGGVGVSNEDDDDDDDDEHQLSKIYSFLEEGLSYEDDDDDDDDDVDQVYKIGVSNDDDDEQQQQQQQQQQQLVLKLENLGFPSCYNFGKIRPIVDIIGSSNGLICLHEKGRDDVSLWNPATRQFRILPKSITIAAGDVGHHRLFAFGFDDKTKDFKVVLLSGLRLRPRRIIDGVSLGPMECFCQVQVYSLSTDSWRLLEGINMMPGAPFPCPDSSSGQGQLLYLDGSCFLMAKFLYSSSEEEEEEECNNRFIISLDLTKEIIISIQLPDHDGDEELYLCYLGKKIALFTKRTDYIGTSYWERFKIWVLNEHYSSSSSSKNVNNESWIQIHWFAIKLFLPGEQNIPRGISNDAVFVLLENGIPGGELGNNKKKKMKLYNLVTKEVKKSFISCDQVLSKAYAYKPSLVSISNRRSRLIRGAI